MSWHSLQGLDQGFLRTMAQVLYTISGTCPLIHPNCFRSRFTLLFLSQHNPNPNPNANPNPNPNPNHPKLKNSGELTDKHPISQQPCILPAYLDNYFRFGQTGSSYRDARFPRISAPLYPLCHLPSCRVSRGRPSCEADHASAGVKAGMSALPGGCVIVCGM